MSVVPIILIDQDGPLADFDLVVHRVLDDAGYDSSLLRRTRWETSDDVLEVFGEEAQRLVDYKRREAGFYRDLPVVEGAQEAVEGLLGAGVHVVVCTAPSLKNPTCASDKIAWLADHFPDLREQFTVVKDKTMVRGDLLVDDKPSVTGFLTPSWRHVRFVTRHHREFAGSDESTSDEALEGWEAWPILLDLLGRP